MSLATPLFGTELHVSQFLPAFQKINCGGRSSSSHVTKEDVRKKIQAANGEYDELLNLVKNGNRGGLVTSQNRLGPRL